MEGFRVKEKQMLIKSIYNNSSALILELRET